MLGHNATVAFLVRLRKMDKRALTVRDVLVLHTVIANPGISGIAIQQAFNYGSRSAVTSNIARLIKHGLIEDRRTEFKQAHPVILHALPAGIEFWAELKSAGE